MSLPVGRYSATSPTNPHLDLINNLSNTLSQIGSLTELLDLTRFKVGVCENLLDPDSDADHQCHAPSPSATTKMPITSVSS
jgi:hypothetical protein